jgi:hypothetical protein
MISDNNPCTHQQKCCELTAKAFTYSHIAANLSAMGSCSAFSFCRNSPLLAAKLALPTQKLQFVNIRQCVSFPLRKFRQIPALRCLQLAACNYKFINRESREHSREHCSLILLDTGYCCHVAASDTST